MQTCGNNWTPAKILIQESEKQGLIELPARSRVCFITRLDFQDDLKFLIIQDQKNRRMHILNEFKGYRTWFDTVGQVYRYQPASE